MTSTDALVEAIAHRLTAQRKDFYQSGMWVALLKLLSHGQPVAISQLAEVTDLSPDAVAKIVSCCGDLEVDGQNQIVGMGLTLNPTTHQFQLNGQALYTWCALDTLLYVAALGQAAEVRSTCPITQNEIRLSVTPEGITDLDPATAVISIAIPAETETCCRSNFCDQGHFFSTDTAAWQWLNARPETYVLPVQQAAIVGRQVAMTMQAGTIDPARV